MAVSRENSLSDILVASALGSKVVSNKAMAEVRQFSENTYQETTKMEGKELFVAHVQNEYLQPLWDFLKTIVLFIVLGYKINLIFI